VPNLDDRVIGSADALGAAVLSHPPADTVTVRFLAATDRDDGTRSDCR
jgi:S1-C subfamily serine protease